MIKFDHQKVNFANSDRIQTNDPQFLTFRNNNNNGLNTNTGRSVFSQKIQIYKSLQKQEQQSQQQQNTPVVRNFKKGNNNLRVLRSQQKYTSSRPYTPVRKLREQQLNKKQKSSLNSNSNRNTINNSNKDNFSSNNNEQFPPTTNTQLSSNQFQFKNQLLKKKILKLVKNIKNQQRRQSSLQKDIYQLQKQLEQDDKQIQSQHAEINQLQSIYEENQTYLQKLTNNYDEFETKNNHLQQLVQKIEDSLQNLLNSSRHQDAKTKMANKLKQGLVKLQTLKLQVSNRSIRIQSEIVKLKQFIQHTDQLDVNIRDITDSRQTQNNSHFTC